MGAANSLTSGLLLVGLLVLAGLAFFAVLPSDEPSLSQEPAPAFPAPCGSLDSSFLRDVCYLNDVMGGKIEQFLEYPVDNCQRIEDTYLQYVCLRLEPRVHMLDFMTGSSIELPSGLPDADGQCSHLEGFPRLYCTYVYAAVLANDDSEAARYLCHLLPTSRLIGECEFYIAISLAMNLKEDTAKKADSVMSFCEDVSHPSWRSECHYLVADELALMRPVSYAEGIALACTRSFEAVDYACFHHAAFLMPLEEGTAYCNLLHEEYREDCFEGLGASIAEDFADDFPAGVEQCDRFPAEHELSCFDGLGWVAGWTSLDNERSLDNVRSSMQKCDTVPGSFADDCYQGFAAAVGRRMVNDVEMGLQVCDQLPVEYLGTCQYHLGWAIGQYHVSAGISAVVSECKALPPEGRDSCLESLIDSIAETSVDDTASAERECGALPLEFKAECHGAVTQFIGKSLE